MSAKNIIYVIDYLVKYQHILTGLWFFKKMELSNTLHRDVLISVANSN